ncbi:MAG TPA: hypothetical protein ENI81_13485 [Phycisphaerales bacterium]|nr:hypothetical protein [Phycisphaerales bacterium]
MEHLEQALFLSVASDDDHVDVVEQGNRILEDLLVAACLVNRFHSSGVLPRWLETYSSRTRPKASWS